MCTVQGKVAALFKPKLAVILVARSGHCALFKPELAVILVARSGHCALFKPKLAVILVARSGHWIPQSEGSQRTVRMASTARRLLGSLESLGLFYLNHYLRTLYIAQHHA